MPGLRRSPARQHVSGVHLQGTAVSLRTLLSHGESLPPLLSVLASLPGSGHGLWAQQQSQMASDSLVCKLPDSMCSRLGSRLNLAVSELELQSWRTRSTASEGRKKGKHWLEPKISHVKLVWSVNFCASFPIDESRVQSQSGVLVSIADTGDTWGMVTGDSEVHKVRQISVGATPLNSNS